MIETSSKINRKDKSISGLSGQKRKNSYFPNKISLASFIFNKSSIIMMFYL
ncbi:hypothetical protein LEP1GSC047_3610 [Leptospira inadai serovar Lyme str. 10]|uniref:Uncharacterized protein n=1 Tax=Leptospira inadai serovar Lyme str. 10 TaxID=1049790 RepID=V6HCL7_9LEPT|nr:hypothetical protein LEP1GSC047_3610 [Leptospira inadai serovar Lyme str. 10]